MRAAPCRGDAGKGETKASAAAAAAARVQSAVLQQSIEKSLKSSLAENLKTAAENEDLKKKLTDLERYSRGLATLSNNLKAENDEMKNALIQLKGSYEKAGELEKRVKELEEKNAELTAKNATVAGVIEKMTAEEKSLQGALDANTIEQHNRELQAKIQEVYLRDSLLTKELSKAVAARQSYVRECGLLHYNLGCMLFKAGDYARAVKEFRKAVDFDPLNADAFYNLAIIYDDYLADNKTAITCYRRFIDINADSRSLDPAVANQIKKKILDAELRERSKIASPVDATMR